jgi:hypothetical protein
LDKSERELAKPVPGSKSKSVGEFFAWAFGADNVDAVLADSRDLKKLGTVLASARATAILRSNKDLDYAFEISGGEEKKLLENLNQASYNLDQALPLSIRHKKSRDVTAALKRCRDTLNEILRHFPTLANDS